jgi:hypothetical protein
VRRVADEKRGDEAPVRIRARANVGQPLERAAGSDGASGAAIAAAAVGCSSVLVEDVSRIVCGMIAGAADVEDNVVYLPVHEDGIPARERMTAQDHVRCR